jgi:hypothetical protein
VSGVQTIAANVLGDAENGVIDRCPGVWVTFIQEEHAVRSHEGTTARLKRLDSLGGRDGWDEMEQKEEKVW